MQGQTDIIEVERLRIQSEYERREKEMPPSLYAPWQPAAMLMAAERKRVAATMLHKAGVFPLPDTECLEVGYGSLGWLGDLITWGVQESRIHGMELDSRRAKRAQDILPAADLRVGDATSLPWAGDSFRLVIASTVFTSILDPIVRQLLAAELVRVIAPGGALLWYDFRVNNPRNPHVRKVAQSELRQLFPGMAGAVRSVTLAPPLARLVARRSWPLAVALGSVPFLRTHLLGVLIKQP